MQRPTNAIAVRSFPRHIAILPASALCREDAGKGEVVRFGGHAVDALLFECHTGYEAVITQFGEEPVVIPAAVPEAHEVAVEGNQGDDGDVEQLLIGFPPALGMQVVKQVRASWGGRGRGALFGQVVLLDRGKNTMCAGASERPWPCKGRYISQPRSYAANNRGCTSTSLVMGS